MYRWGASNQPVARAIQRACCSLVDQMSLSGYVNYCAKKVRGGGGAGGTLLGFTPFGLMIDKYARCHTADAARLRWEKNRKTHGQ